VRLMIKQRVFALTDTYDVIDEEGNVKYFVKAEFLSLGHVIHVFEKATECEVGVIRQKILTFFPQFKIEINGQTAGSIVKMFSLLFPRYEIDFNGWQADGDFLGWDYNVVSNNFPIIHISKELFHWGDTYVIDFTNPEDEVMGLLLVLAIDAVNCTKNK